MNNRICFILLLALAGSMAFTCTQKEPYFKTRGIVLSIEDIETLDWPKLAHENGINTLGSHFPTEGFIQTEKGRKFLSDCKKYGITVESQLHAMSMLLPRKLFAEDSTLFRMDQSGCRINDYNLCVHSQKALDIVAENALHYARLLPSANHRYYFWIDDGQPMCACHECSEYSDSEQSAGLGIQHITTFAVYVDDKYLAAYDNDIRFLKEYGMGLKNYKKNGRPVMN